MQHIILKEKNFFKVYKVIRNKGNLKDNIFISMII